MVWPLGSFLCPPGYAAPSGLRAIAREAAVVAETARLVRRTAHHRLPWGPDPIPADTADGQGPVVLVPGFLAGDTTLLMMSRHLRRAGYRTHRARIRANVGCTAKAATALEERIERLVEHSGARATVVG